MQCFKLKSHHCKQVVTVNFFFKVLKASNYFTENQIRCYVHNAMARDLSELKHSIPGAGHKLSGRALALLDPSHFGHTSLQKQ